MKSENIIATFGDKDLLNETLLKCTMALKGDMITFIYEKVPNGIVIPPDPFSKKTKW